MLLNRNAMVSLKENSENVLRIQGLKLSHKDTSVEFTVHGVTNPRNAGRVGNFSVEVRNCGGTLLERTAIVYDSKFDTPNFSTLTNPCVLVDIQIT